MWFLIVVGLDALSVLFVGASARAGRSVLPGVHLLLAAVMVVMASFGAIPHGRTVLPVILLAAGAAALVLRGRCSQPTCWHLIACALGMGLLALQLPGGASDPMSGMSGMGSMGAARSMGSMGTLGIGVGCLVLVGFATVAAFQAAALVRRPANRGTSIALERFALLTGSLAMAAMALGMLFGAAAPLAA